MQRLLAALLLPAVALPVAADVEPASSFGSGCAGASGAEPTLATPPFAVAGAQFEVEFTAGPSLVGLLFVGVQTDTWLAFELPLDLALFGQEACELLVPPDVTIPIFTDAEGAGSISLPGFGSGSTLYLQAYFVDFEDGVFDPLVAFSDAVELNGVNPSGRQPGDLVITEIMKDPTFVTDSAGEWFEVFNTTPEPIDLALWCLADDSGQLVVLEPAGPIEVPPLGYAVLGNEADPASNGGVDVLYDWSVDGSFTLSNDADTIRLVTPDGIVVDEVAYLSDNGWLDADGASLELAEGIFEWDVNDDGSVWEVAECFIGGSAGFNTDLGSPGLSNESCPFPTIPIGSGELIFCEVIQNPSGVPDAFGEWFEVYNTTAGAIDMQGFTVTLGGGTFGVEGPLVVPAGGYQVFARNGDPALNGGLPASVYDYPDALVLPNGSQTLTLTDPGGGTVCLIQYDNGLTFPDPTGASMALDPARLTLLDAVDGTAWCASTSTFGTAGDLGTPGGVNDPCP